MPSSGDRLRSAILRVKSARASHQDRPALLLQLEGDRSVGISVMRGIRAQVRFAPRRALRSSAGVNNGRVDSGHANSLTCFGESRSTSEPAHVYRWSGARLTASGMLVMRRSWTLRDDEPDCVAVNVHFSLTQGEFQCLFEPSRRRCRQALVSQSL